MRPSGGGEDEAARVAVPLGDMEDEPCCTEVLEFEETLERPMGSGKGRFKGNDMGIST